MTHSGVAFWKVANISRLYTIKGGAVAQLVHLQDAPPEAESGVDEPLLRRNKVGPISS